MKKAEITRNTILNKAFELIYSNGYQATSVDEILASTQVTKGAFYYHFKNKDEMGVAIIEELLKPALYSSFVKPLHEGKDPAVSIYKLMYHLLIADKFLKVEFGCPVSNLSQEMTPWNINFKRALNELTEEWTSVMVRAIERGKQGGFVRKNVNAREVTLFIMSAYWGIRNFGKLQNNKKIYRPYLNALKTYLASLKK